MGLSPEFMTQEGSKPLAFRERCFVLKEAEGAGHLNPHSALHWVPVGECCGDSRQTWIWTVSKVAVLHQCRLS